MMRVSQARAVSAAAACEAVCGIIMSTTSPGMGKPDNDANEPVDATERSRTGDAGRASSAAPSATRLGAGARTIVSIVAASPLLTRSELARWSPLSSGVPRTRGLTRRSDLPLFRSCLDITGCYNKMREVMGVTI